MPASINLDVGSKYPLGGSKTLSLGAPHGRGDVCEFFLCTLNEPATPKTGGTRFDRIGWDDDDETPVLLKVASNPVDDDLVENEAARLGKIFPPSAPDEKMHLYLPRLLGTFDVMLRGTLRKGNLLLHYPSLVSFAQVREAYPSGLDFRDVVWMFKRTLVVIGFAHFHKMVHSAVLPPHVLVDPVGHGAKLVDWSYATDENGRVGAISRHYEAYYAPEILNRERVSARADIYMAAACAAALMGATPGRWQLPDSVPPEIQSFFAKCLEPNPARRPPSAWDLHEEFDKLLERLIGPPEYRPLAMPAPAHAPF